MACPLFEDLVSLQQGELEASRQALILQHLSDGCVECARNFKWIGETMKLARTDDSFSFPDDLIQWSVAQFKVASGEHSGIESILARLIFDSLAPVLVTEVRSAAHVLEANRQMLFRAGAYDVDIRLEGTRQGPAIGIMGQVLCAEKRLNELAGLQIRLVDSCAPPAEPKVFETSTDSRGMFRFNVTPAAEYCLAIHVPEGEIHIPAIRTGRQDEA